MKMRVVISPDGKIGFFTDEGTFAQGKEKIESMMAALKAAGINIAEASPVEQHRHDDGLVHAHTHAGSHNH